MLFFEIQLGCHVISCKINDGFIFCQQYTGTIKWGKSRNDLSLAKYYFIILHNKTIFKTINTQMVFDSIRYIVEHFILFYPPFSLCLIGKNPRRESYLYMCEQYRTKGRTWFSSLNTYAHQHCNMCNNKSSAHEFTIFWIIVSLYYPSISDTYSFMFSSQSMILTPYTKGREINGMTPYFYPCGFFFGTNKMIASIIVLFEFMQSSHSCSSKYWFNHHI